MVKIFKLFAYLFFFVMALIYFAPKQNLYFYAEQELQKLKVVFSKEEIVENAFSLQLNHMKLLYDSIESADVGSLNVELLLLYNVVSAKDIELSSMAASFVPLRIKSVEVKYSILNPINVIFQAEGEFGEAYGKLNIVDRNVSVVLKPSLLMLNAHKGTMKELHKNKNGEYSYDKTF